MYRGPAHRRAPSFTASGRWICRPERHLAVLVAMTDGSAVRDVLAPRAERVDRGLPATVPIGLDEAGRQPRPRFYDHETPSMARRHGCGD
jgi:hypothetical protein